MRPTPVTKDKRRQKNIIKAAQRQTDRLGIAATFTFTPDGEMLVDGHTHEEINDAYDAAILKFFQNNEKYLDPDYPNAFKMLARPGPAIIYELPVAIGPTQYNPSPVIHKFEERRDHR